MIKAAQLIFDFFESATLKLTDTISGVPFSKNRSSKWPQARRDYLKEHPVCEITGETKNLDVHHIVPFHVRPDLELLPSNMITLTRRKGIHFIFGHLLNWKSWNENIDQDAEMWRNKILNRPLLKKAEA